MVNCVLLKTKMRSSVTQLGSKIRLLSVCLLYKFSYFNFTIISHIICTRFGGTYTTIPLSHLGLVSTSFI